MAATSTMTERVLLLLLAAGPRASRATGANPYQSTYTSHKGITHVISGHEPPTSMGTSFPVYVYLAGTGDDPQWRNKPNQFTREMANRGYMSAFCPYDDWRMYQTDTGWPMPASCAELRRKVQSSVVPCIQAVCSRPKANCDYGLAVHGFSQGGMLASLTKFYVPQVTATLTFSAAFALGGVQYSCMRSQNLPLPRSKRRMLIGLWDTLLILGGNPRWQARLTSGYNCGPAASNYVHGLISLDCIRADGSGYFVVDYSRLGGSPNHCLFVANGPTYGHFGGCNTNNYLHGRFLHTGQKWGLSANLNWLAAAARVHNAPTLPPPSPPPPSPPSNTPPASYWTKGQGHSCVGISSGTDIDSVTSTLWGPCDNEQDGPEAFVAARFKGVGVVNEAFYSTCTVEPCGGALEVMGHGFRDFGNYTKGGGEWGYAQVGSLFGASWGGIYLGVMSTFNTGQVPVSNYTAEIYVASYDHKTPVTRESTNIGAPLGPHHVCVAPSQTCASEYTYLPGQGVLSFYGYKFDGETGWLAEMASKANEGKWPSTVTHIVGRVTFTGKGVHLAEATFNHGLYDVETVRSQDVTSMSLQTDKGTIDLDFADQFNSGPLQDGSTAYPPMSAKFRATYDISSGDAAIHIDILLPMDHFQLDDMWFMLPGAVIQMGYSPPPAPPISWKKSKTGSVCAGAIIPCVDTPTCNSAYIGPCESEVSGPESAFIELQTMGVGVVNEANYLNCPANTVCSTIVQATGQGYRDLGTRARCS